MFIGSHIPIKTFVSENRVDIGKYSVCYLRLSVRFSANLCVCISRKYSYGNSYTVQQVTYYREYTTKLLRCIYRKNHTVPVFPFRRDCRVIHDTTYGSHICIFLRSGENSWYHFLAAGYINGLPYLRLCKCSLGVIARLAVRSQCGTGRFR